MEANPSVNVKYVVKYVVAAYDSDMLLSRIFIILDMLHLHMLMMMEANPSVNVKYVVKYVVAAYDSGMLLSHVFIILNMSHLHILNN
jgi:hypothetical protein